LNAGWPSEVANDFITETDYKISISEGIPSSLNEPFNFKKQKKEGDIFALCRWNEVVGFFCWRGAGLERRSELN